MRALIRLSRVPKWPSTGLRSRSSCAALRTNTAVANMAHGGKLAQLGIPTEEIGLDFNEIVFEDVVVPLDRVVGDGRLEVTRRLLSPTRLKQSNGEIVAGKGELRRLLDRDELIAQSAAQLADSKVVGWFNGRMEFGPRALGGRSILADPRRVEALSPGTSPARITAVRSPTKLYVQPKS